MLNRSEILRDAWQQYRFAAVKGEAFDRKAFAYCLRMAWACAKEDAARRPVAPVVVAPATRADAIRVELRDMEYGDRIDWTRHNNLSAELARLAA